MNSPASSLLTSASIAEQAGKPVTARFWREMAKDALNLETAFPELRTLYRNWAEDVAVRAEQMKQEKAA